MKSNIYLKDKKSHLSNHKLIGYMVDIGSRFIDLLIKAFKNKNIHQKFRISKNGRIVDNLKSNQYGELLSMLNIYNAKLKRNLEKFKEKNIENQEFTKLYNIIKINSTNNKVKCGKESENFLQDILFLYQEKKNYSFSSKYLSKNIFKESPLLILGNDNLYHYFQKDFIINGFNSINSAKTICFLKRVLEDAIDLYKTSSSILPNKMNKANEENDNNNNILKFNFFKKNKEEILFKKKQYKKMILNINQTKKEIDVLLNLIDVCNEKDKSKNECNKSVILNNNTFLNNNDIQKDLNLSVNLPSIKKYDNDISINKTKTNFNSILTKRRNSLNIDRILLSKNKKMYSIDNTISTKLLDRTKTSFLDDSYSKSIIEESKKSFSERKRIKKLNISKIYDKLKQNELILRNKKQIIQTRKYLNEIYDEEKIKKFNSKKIPYDIYRNFSHMSRIVEENIPKKIINIYKKRIPYEMNEKIDEVKNLDEEINKIDKHFIKFILNQKSKTNEIDNNSE